MIRHHMVLINDQVVRWPEHELSPGDRISIDIHQASIIPHVWAYLTYISVRGARVARGAWQGALGKAQPTTNQPIPRYRAKPYVAEKLKMH